MHIYIRPEYNRTCKPYARRHMQCSSPFFGQCIHCFCKCIGIQRNAIRIASEIGNLNLIVRKYGTLKNRHLKRQTFIKVSEFVTCLRCTGYKQDTQKNVKGFCQYFHFISLFYREGEEGFTPFSCPSVYHLIIDAISGLLHPCQTNRL